MGNATCLAVIPARGGSKRIPRKNLQPVGDLPLVLWTARAARDAERLTAYMVSTEDTEIARACIKDGHDIWPRAPWMASDHVWSATVVMDALSGQMANGFLPDLICLLHPTSPFRSAEDIHNCIRIAEEWDASVISFMNDDLNGAIYVCPTSLFIETGSFFHNPIWPYNMDPISGLDIDTPEDLDEARLIAEWMAP
jgi:CMP-N-acetylneuraminic acid synthetase